MLRPEGDMPFSESGIIPDIIFNPNGFPSRMTIGMMVESMCGKAGALHGRFQDSTPFRFDDQRRAFDYFGEQLLQQGFSFYGNETLYSGYTGEPLHLIRFALRTPQLILLANASFKQANPSTWIFLLGLFNTSVYVIWLATSFRYAAPIDTARWDWIRLTSVFCPRQVRSTGPINPLTRQPIRGRKVGGAIRFGEMERDALLGYGAAYLLHDRY